MTDEIKGTGKGIAGGALLGGEIGFLGLSAFGAKQTWMYWTIPTALAIGGGVGGYFIEKSATPAIPVAMLAGGMALIIPTVVITLSANRYSPVSEDGTPIDATPTGPAEVKVNAGAQSTTGGTPTTPVPATGGAGSTSTTPPPGATKHKPDKGAYRLRPQPPVALVNLQDDAHTLAIGVPALQVKPMYSANEVAMYGVQQKYEFHAPVVNVAF